MTLQFISPILFIGTDIFIHYIGRCAVCNRHEYLLLFLVFLLFSVFIDDGVELKQERALPAVDIYLYVPIEVLLHLIFIRD